MHAKYLLCLLFINTSIVNHLSNMNQPASEENTQAHKAGDISWHKIMHDYTIEEIKELLESNTELYNTKKDLLHYAACNGRLDLINFFITQEISVNQVDDDGNTPLFASITGGQVDAIKLLLTLDADINHKNNKHQTPLGYAKEMDRDRSEALFLAIMRKPMPLKQIITLLEEHGATE